MKTLFKSELENFVAKRAAVYCALLSIAAIAFFQNRWFLVPGLMVGAGFSVFSFCSYSWLFRIIIGLRQARSRKRQKVRNLVCGIFASAFKEFILFLLLLLAYSFQPWFFAGMAAGALLVPLVIITNAITEFLGITRNDFYI